MKKLILSISLLIFSVATLASATYTNTTLVAPDLPNLDIWEILTKATNWFFGIVIMIAVIMIIAAGFTYITSGGADTKIKSALNKLIFALVGVAIALLAKGLIYLICNFISSTWNCTFF